MTLFKDGFKAAAFFFLVSQLMHGRDVNATRPTRPNVHPHVPTLLTPENARYKLLHKSMSFRLQWKPLACCKVFVFRLYQDGAEVFKKEVKGTYLDLRNIPLRQYSWDVSALIPELTDNRSLAQAAPDLSHSQSGKAIKYPEHFQDGNATKYNEGPPSVLQKFKLELLSLNKEGVSLIQPNGKTYYSSEPIEFRWEKSSNKAEVYYLSLYKKQKTWRKIAFKEDIKENSTRALASTVSPGEYKWTIETKNPHKNEITSQSETTFYIVDARERNPGDGFFSAGLQINSTSYKGADSTFETKFSTKLLGLVLTSEYWFSRHFGMNAQFMQVDAQFKGRPTRLFGTDGSLLFRFPLRSFPEDWRIHFGLGLGHFSLPEVLATSETTFNYNTVRRLSVLPSLKLLHLITSKTFIFTEVLGNQNITLSGGATGVKQQKTVWNYKLGVGLQSFFLHPLGVMGQARYAQEGFKYSSNTDEVSINFLSTEFLFSLLYSF